jgi:pimeloyl-ACP methyl ester carboxylesterase
MTGLLLTLLLAAPNTKKLAEEYFKADEARRFAIREELKEVDALTAAEVEKWRPILLKLARKSKKRLQRSGTNYLYDKKEKQGKYIVGGGNGRGGLIIALHGGGEGQGNAGGAAGTFGSIGSKFKCVTIAPEVLFRTERGWTSPGTEKFVLELIERAKRTWKIPHDRIYVCGHSMGGFGSWTYGARHADLFAGVGPYAGAPVPITVDGGARSKVIGIEDGIIPNLINSALHVYQSLDDVQVPPEPNVFANQEILRWRKEYGGYEKYKYVEVNGRGHGAPPGGHVKGFKWLYQFKRNSRPRHILWQPVLSYKRMFYWLWWDRPAAKALVEVKILENNTINVNIGGEDRDGLRLLLDDKLVDLSKEVVVKDDDEVLFKGKVGYTLSTMLMTAAEKYDSLMLFAARIDLK